MPKQNIFTNWDEVPLMLDLPLVMRIFPKSYEWLKKKSQREEFPAKKYGEEWLITKSEFREYLGDMPTEFPEDYIKAFKDVAAEMFSLNEQLIKDVAAEMLALNEQLIKDVAAEMLALNEQLIKKEIING